MIFSWDSPTRTLTVNLPFKLRIKCEGYLVESNGLIGLNSQSSIVFVNTPMQNGLPTVEAKLDKSLAIKHNDYLEYAPPVLCESSLSSKECEVCRVRDENFEET